LTLLSQPAEAKRFTLCVEEALAPWGVTLLAADGVGTMREPGRVAGAQETAVHPTACPLKMSAPQVPSSEGIG